MANDGNGNDYLSQEEIDALLNQTSSDSGEGESDGGDGSAEGNTLDVGDFLTVMEKDALGEIGNITFGSSATALSTLLGKKVDITTPTVSILKRSGLEEEFPQPHVAVHVKYVDGFQGINLLVIKTRDAQVIADLMLGGDGSNTGGELTELHVSAIQEAMNQMMGSAATSMSTIFNRMVNISPPGIDIMDIKQKEGTDNVPDVEFLVSISFQLKIEDLVDSSIMQLLTVPFSKEMVEGLLGASQEDDQPQAATSPTQEEGAADILSQEELDELMEREVPAPTPNRDSLPKPEVNTPPVSRIKQREVNVQPAEFSAFGADSGSQSGDMNLNLLLDIPLKVTVELGRTKKLIRDILEFTQGSIIELDKLAGEPVDIMVNEKLIAKGEVVVIDENFGVRVTDIVSKADRLSKIQ